MKMSKSCVTQLAAALVAKDKLQQAEAEKFIKTMFDVANEGLQTDKLLKMRWLGTFKVQATKDRESIDVNTGERILIEGRDKICFTPDSVLKDIVNKPFAQFETVILDDNIDFSGIDEKYGENENQNVIEEENLNAVEEDTAQDNGDEKNMQDEKIANDTVSFLDCSANPQQGVSDQVVVIGAKAEEPELQVIDEPIIPTASTSTMAEEENIEKEVLEEDTSAPEQTNEQGKIPRYFIVAVILFALVAVGGFAWFSFSYHQMSARCEQLALQLEGLKHHKNTVAASIPKTSSKQVVQKENDSVKMALRQREDSLRMLQASKVVEQVTKETANAYDSDIRIKTGAYHIVGTAQTVTVRKGQTLSSISKTYLGPGMDCYVEAYNGITEVKEGQKIKIPKLEIKKKR